ncbi:DUF4258 domain-containing protein [Algoriphagus yeomjeoni]|uniref:DUF4258 domain-containing protein n=1 Tax=Algoriphagus yeomjeoni TaxID=291403 RepID=UPI003CE539D1
MNSVYFRCRELIYSDHAINQMFNRDITTEDIEEVIRLGEIINDYPNDRPFPSCLILGFATKRPLHLVIAINELESKCVIITAYEPDPKLWAENFKFKI